MRMRFKPYAHDELMAADFHVHEPLIWGGKWHEYDLMHFEYRPEIMAKAHLLRQLEMAGGDGRDGGTAASLQGPPAMSRTEGGNS